MTNVSTPTPLGHRDRVRLSGVEMFSAIPLQLEAMATESAHQHEEPNSKTVQIPVLKTVYATWNRSSNAT